MNRVIFCGWLIALLLLGGCSWLGAGLTGREIVAQANEGDKIAFDVVKIDDAVVGVLRAQGEPAFHERFKKYTPPPDFKIEIGDTVSVVIWEAAANGLFGESLVEWSVPSNVARRLLAIDIPGATIPLNLGQGLTAASPEMLAQLLGRAAGVNSPATPAPPTTGNLPQLPVGGQAQALAGVLGAQQGGAAVSALGGLAAQQTPLGLAAGGATGLASGGLGAQQTTLPGLVPGSAAALGQPTTSLNRGITSQTLEELLQNAAASGRPGTRIPDQQVASDGAISIPYAGRIEAAGHTPAEVERRIEQRLGPRALEPHALVSIRQSVANSVSIAGEAVKGGRVPLPPGGERLLQVIAATGGADAPVHELFLQLSRNGITATVPLATLVEHPEENIFAEPGDVLTLVRRPQTFSVFGATGKNAAITFNSEKLSLAEGLAKAGGLRDERADPRAVFLFRYEPEGVVRALGQPVATVADNGASPVVYRLDLSDAKSYPLAQQFPVRDKDIIFVANAESQALYRFFTALSNVSGPVITGLLTCQSTTC